MPVEQTGSNVCMRDGVWSVTVASSAGLDATRGIGVLVNRNGASDFVMHDHQYVQEYVPDPERARITYTFRQPTLIAELHVVQHANGVDIIEGFAGDRTDALASIGVARSLRGSFRGRQWAEKEVSIFRFPSPRRGLVFQFIIRGTVLANGYALYRAFPAEAAISPALVRSIAIPDRVGTGGSLPRTHGVWSLSVGGDGAINTESGVGNIINEAWPNLYDFTMHDHVYQASYVPDPVSCGAGCAGFACNCNGV